MAAERTTVEGSIVRLDREGDVRFWTRFFGCSIAELRSAVDKAGPELWTIQGYIWAQREKSAERMERPL